MSTLLSRVRSRTSQFAASHPMIYRIAAVAFALIVGLEVYTMTSFGGPADGEHIDDAETLPVLSPLGEEERALAFPHAFGVAEFDPGDAVEVAVWTDPLTGGADGHIVRPARVLSVGDATTIVAVPVDAVLRVVEALGTGTAALVGAPPTPG